MFISHIYPSIPFYIMLINFRLISNLITISFLGYMTSKIALFHKDKLRQKQYYGHVGVEIISSLPSIKKTSGDILIILKCNFHRNIRTPYIVIDLPKWGNPGM